MSYKEPKPWKWLTRGSAVGCLAGIGVMVASWPVLFAVVWGCVPEHRINGADDCNVWNGRLVFLAMLAAAAVAFWLCRRFIDKADTSSDE